MEVIKKWSIQILVGLVGIVMVAILKYIVSIYSIISIQPIKDKEIEEHFKKVDQSIEILNAGSDNHYLVIDAYKDSLIKNCYEFELFKMRNHLK